MIENLESELLQLLKNFITENQIQVEGEVTVLTRLIGSNSIFDSMDLVTFIVEVENEVNERTSYSIELANDRAMSRRTSPFMNIQSLVSYINEILNE